jgi:hypothetical protein
MLAQSRRAAVVATAALLTGAYWLPATAQDQSRTQGPNQLSQTVGVTVPENTSSTIRMLNLSQGTRLAFAMQAQDALWVLFMNEENWKRFPQGATPVLSARVSAALSFGVQVPADGNYYLVLDNREHATPNPVKMQLRATLPAGAKRPSDPKPLLQQY